MKKYLIITIIGFITKWWHAKWFGKYTGQPSCKTDQWVGVMYNGQRFWAERFAVCRDNMLPQLMENLWTSDSMCFAFKNFKVAAGIDTRFRGPFFHDGDFIKHQEAVCHVCIQKIKTGCGNGWCDYGDCKAKKEDGYIFTKNPSAEQKEERQNVWWQTEFWGIQFWSPDDTACVHYRATGKTNLLDIAKKAAIFNWLLQHATPEQAIMPFAPRIIWDWLCTVPWGKKYTELVNKLIDIRGTSEGSDDNAINRHSGKMTAVNGHEVFVCRRGRCIILKQAIPVCCIRSIWCGMMWWTIKYITGGCGALYDGLALEVFLTNPMRYKNSAGLRQRLPVTQYYGA